MFAVKAFYKNGDSFVIAEREFRREFGIHRCRAVPSARAIKTWVRNFEATGSTVKKKGCSVKTVRTPENIAAVREAIGRSSHRYARRHAVSLGLSEASVRRILHKDLHFCPYKIEVTDALHERDYVNKLLMSGEAHFRSSGFVKKQNFRYWCATNPMELHERPLHNFSHRMVRDIFIWNYRSLLL